MISGSFHSFGCPGAGTAARASRKTNKICFYRNNFLEKRMQETEMEFRIII